jgi:hypothetical protein
MRRGPHIHPIGCSCNACAAPGEKHRRAKVAIKGAGRALFLIIALCAIPFIVAWALAGAAGERR